MSHDQSNSITVRHNIANTRSHTTF